MLANLLLIVNTKDIYLHRKTTTARNATVVLTFNPPPTSQYSPVYKGVALFKIQVGHSINVIGIVCLVLCINFPQ